MHLFRHLAQKFLAGRQPSGVISIQSDEKSDCASAPPALCGVAYIKDVIVHPDYQGRGVGRMLMEALLRFIRENGVSGTEIAAELCAMPDKMPFYAKFGFRANEAQRMRLMYRAE